jgi:hypothetical protein
LSVGACRPAKGPERCIDKGDQDEIIRVGLSSGAYLEGAWSGIVERMEVHPRFWVLCREHIDELEPLAVSVPTLGEALAVFGFEEEALLYLSSRYGDGDLHPRPLASDELVALLLGSWSRFELVALDPMPEDDVGIMLRLASIRREDFLDFLLALGEKRRGIKLEV